MCEKVEPGSLVPEVDDKGYLNDDGTVKEDCCALLLYELRRPPMFGLRAISATAWLKLNFEFEPSVFSRGKNKKMTKFYLKNLEKSAR